uniref:Retrovirus-related Pol polyprotein from transposon TNT 1-94 n=1 Tax=Lygus hesperus TaxID=30085 RepID=A0A0A9Z310_LYGHE
MASVVRLGNRFHEWIFAGYSEFSKAYRIWVPNLNRIEISRDVRILENFPNLDNTNERVDSFDLIEYPYEWEDRISTTIQKGEEIPTIPEENPTIQEDDAISTIQEEEVIDANEENNEDNELVDESTHPPRTTRSGREIKTPTWMLDYDMSCLCDEKFLETEGNPEIWEEAIKAEIRAHVKNGTWEITKLPPDRNAVGYRMILKEKLNPDGTLERRKARLVAQGFSQRPGLDYSETYSPVVKMKSLRLLIGIAAEQNLKLNQLDVTTAYLNGTLDEEIYMKKPQGLEKYLQQILKEESKNADKTIYQKTKRMLRDLHEGNQTEKVCALKKSLYGLKQAGRQWYKKLDARLKEIGFISSCSEPCLYIRGEGEDKILLAVYVDDLIIASSNEKETEKLKKDITEVFEMRDIGELKYCLGIEFCRRGKNVIAMSQEKYVDKLLEKFKLENAKTAKTPMEANLQLTKPSEGNSPAVPYQNLIGSLMYLATATRPDIMYSVSYLSQFNSCYRNEHWAHNL